MTSTSERLQFAVRFATMNLAGARPGDWSNLRLDLEIFIQGSAAVQETAGLWLGRSSPAPDAMSDTELRRLQGTTRTLLEDIADQQAGRKGPDLETGVQTPSCDIRPMAAGGGIMYLLGGTPRDVFLALLLRLLGQADTASPILRCPECDGLFYRVRKQKYCSRPCVAKANWRAYVKTDDGKKAKRRSDKNRSKKVAAAKAVKKARANR